MPDKSEKKIVYFLPYFPIEKEIRIGNILFWPFYRMRETYIEEENIRVPLEKIFGCYVNRDGEATRSITIASIGGQHFSPFSENELENLDSAVKVLAFASIIKNPYEFQYRNSENFQVYSQELVPGEETLTIFHRFRRSVYGGHVHSLGPYKFEQVKFIQPDSVLVSGTKELDQRMLGALEKILDSRRSNLDAERILRALEWFYFAHFDLRDIPDTVIVVMMATAFESLLNISDTGKTRDFIEKMEIFLVNKARGFLDGSAKKGISRRDWKRKARNYTKAGWWAHDFYGARSDIVHGRNWNLLYDGKSQLEIADLVFIECLKRKLEEKYLYIYSPEDEKFRKEICKAVGF